jgi:hypothetical protein
MIAKRSSERQLKLSLVLCCLSSQLELLSAPVT